MRIKDPINLRQVALPLEEQLNWNDCPSGQVHQGKSFHRKVAR